jgi:hypothetical protein
MVTKGGGEYYKGDSVDSPTGLEVRIMGSNTLCIRRQEIQKD